MEKIQNWTEGEASDCKALKCFYAKNGLTECENHCMENDECNLINFCPSGASCRSNYVANNRCCSRHCTNGEHKMVTRWKGWDVYEKVAGISVICKHHRFKIYQAFLVTNFHTLPNCFVISFSV